jgi:N utilization substance protein A
MNAGYDVRVEINPKTGHLQAWSIFEVVDSMSDPQAQIHVAKAKDFNPEADVSDVVEKEIDPALLSPIANQCTRQTIVQGIRHFEREKLYHDFKNSIGGVVSGIVRRQEAGNIHVEIGKAEAILRYRERISGEKYAAGDRVC